MPLRDVIVERVQTSGPMTFAEYMDLALYHPELGYYARADRRSGRAGDFFTSVDLGPIFGQLLEIQIEEMWRLVQAPPRSDTATRHPDARFDVIEAGAGSGRLARDLLDAAVERHRRWYDALRLTLVERAPTARTAQPATLGPHASRLVASVQDLPAAITGLILSNELLDAMPVHVVVMGEHELREMYVDVANGHLVERPGPPSTSRLEAYLDRAGIRLLPGARAEINLDAIDWMTRAAHGLERGFLVVIDYGHEAVELYSATHAAGTLTGFRGHRAWPSTVWLDDPGSYDLTAHVDLTAVRETAEREGLQTLAVLDQTYFLLGLGAADAAGRDDGSIASIRKRLVLKTLLLPGGLGSTHKVLIFGKNVGTPALRCTSYGVRVT